MSLPNAVRNGGISVAATVSCGAKESTLPIWSTAGPDKSIQFGALFALAQNQEYLSGFAAQEEE